MNRLSHFFAWFLVCVFVVNVFAPLVTVASAISYVWEENVCYYNEKGKAVPHSYSTDAYGTEISDICKECGFERLHGCSKNLSFVTIRNNVVSRPEPRDNNLEEKRFPNIYTPLSVQGRIRNERSNLWLYLSDGSFIYVDRTAFDFDAFVEDVIDYVGNWNLAPVTSLLDLPAMWKNNRKKCVEWLCWIYFMFSAFKDDGEFDIKKSSLLGNQPKITDIPQKYVYHIYSNGIIQPKSLTGKQLGNIVYGVVCSHYNVPYRIAMQFTGAEILKELLHSIKIDWREFTGIPYISPDVFENSINLGQCVLGGDVNACDDETGVEYTKIGYWIDKHRGEGVSWNYNPDAEVITGYNIWSNGEPELASISDVVAPQGILPYGQPFDLRGSISSGTILTNVTAYIYNASGNAIAHYSKNPNKTVYNIYSDGLNFDSQFRFGVLPSGNYQYVVSATNAAGTKELINSSFSIGAAPQKLSVLRYEDCYVLVQCPYRTVNLYRNPTDTVNEASFGRGQAPRSYRRAIMSDGSTWYEVNVNHNGVETTLWLKYESDIGITDLSEPTPPPSNYQTVQPEDSSPGWSGWSYTPAYPSSTLEVETRQVVNIEGHMEYRYWRWTDGTSVNWCKEYGESQTGKTFYEEYTSWTTVPFPVEDVSTPYYQCGHYDSEHPSHKHVDHYNSVGGYPLWKRYCFHGISGDEYHWYWEETRWVDTTYMTQYRTRAIEIPSTVKVALVLYDGRTMDYTLFCTEGQPYGELPTPTRDGYTFDGWYTLEMGGEQIISSSIFGKSSDSILFAHWTPLPPKIYTVTFDPNGGYVAPTSMNVTEKEAYGTLPTPVRSDYTFDGWYTSASGGTAVTSSSTVNITGSQTLYAHWTKIPPKSYTVTFDPNGGSVSLTSKTVTNGETYGIFPVPARADYTFDGWYTSASDGTAIASSSIVNLTGSQTLYAHWTKTPPKSYTITFDPNGGSVDPTSKTVTNGDTYGDLPVPTRNGYIFDGWQLKSASGDLGAKVSSFSVVDLSSAQTLQACWIDEEINLQFGDVSSTDYFYEAVKWAVRGSITNGTTATTFSPHTTCSTAHILTFLWRTWGSPQPEIENPFTDVNMDSYFANAALWAYEKGLVSGNTFNGGNPCTRAVTVTYLWKLAGMPSVGTNSFEDVSTDADYAQAVSWAVNQGITNGTTETTFSPDRICTRGQIVTFLWRDLAQ